MHVMKASQSENSSHPVSDPYQQALQDFGIAELLDKLVHFSSFNALWMPLEPQELESLAAILVRQLTCRLNSRLITDFLNPVNRVNTRLITDLPLIDHRFLQSPIAIPEEFPFQTPAPLFLYGDSVRWIPLIHDPKLNCGTIIGRYFAYAQHQGQWAWKYVLWLEDPTSLVRADTAWEDDLELEVEEKDL
jgi:hypothetical protein